MTYVAEKRKLSKEGLIGTILFHLILLLCFLFLVMAAHPPLVKGMVVNFGTVAESSGDEMPSSPAEEATTAESELELEEVADAEAENLPSSEAPEAVIEKEIVTDVKAETPSLPTKDEKKKAEQEKERLKKKAAAAAAAAKAKREKEREEAIKPETLFGGKRNSDSNEETSQGNSNDPMGDQGIDDPLVSNNSQGSESYTPSRDIGMGDSGSGRQYLEGRSVQSRAQVDDSSQKSGKIRIKIKVDQNGNVIGADYVAKNSTSSDASLKRKAIAAAKKWRFNADRKKPPVQVGYIDFTFKVN